MRALSSNNKQRRASQLGGITSLQEQLPSAQGAAFESPLGRINSISASGGDMAGGVLPSQSLPIEPVCEEDKSPKGGDGARSQDCVVLSSPVNWVAAFLGSTTAIANDDVEPSAWDDDTVPAAAAACLNIDQASF